MKFKLLVVLLIPFIGFCQKKSIDKLLDTYNTRSIPYISVQQLKMNTEAFAILDTRKKEEFDVSHLPGAVWVGEKTEDAFLDSLMNSKKITSLFICANAKPIGIVHVHDLLRLST